MLVPGTLCLVLLPDDGAGGGSDPYLSGGSYIQILYARNSKREYGLISLEPTAAKP